MMQVLRAPYPEVALINFGTGQAAPNGYAVGERLYAIETTTKAAAEGLIDDLKAEVSVTSFKWDTWLEGKTFTAFTVNADGMLANASGETITGNYLMGTGVSLPTTVFVALTSDGNGGYRLDANLKAGHGDIKSNTTFKGTGSTYSGTAAIPEPTSVLLMLLGMAGLALRRKQA